MRVVAIRKVEFGESWVGTFMRVRVVFKIDGKEFKDYRDFSEHLSKRLTEDNDMRVLLDKAIYEVISEVRKKLEYTDVSLEFAKKIYISGKSEHEVKTIIKEETEKLREVVKDMFRELKERIDNAKILREWIIEEYRLAEIEL